MKARGERRRGFAALVLAAIVSAAPAAEWSLTGALGAHDPTIIRADGFWWCFTTGAGLPVKYSRDGLAWAQGVRLIETERTWWRTWAPAMGALDVWAPDVQQFNGRYWCYYSVSEFGRNNSAIGLMSCSSILAGDWRDDGFVIGTRSGQQLYNAIDPHLTIDAAGRPWLAFGSWFDGIQIVSLDAATMKPNGTVQAIARRANGVEAANIVYAHGYYHLFVSIDQCCQGVASTYKIAHGRSVNITGPYEDRDGVPLLAGGGSLLEVSGARWKGPGGQDVYRDSDAWIIARHAYDASNFGNPALRIADLYWDADKWPTFSAPAPMPVIAVHPVSVTQPSGTSATLSVTATGPALGYQWSKDNAPISGATSATLDFAALQAGDAGGYTVEITNAAGSVTSRPARLVVADPVPGHLVNMSVRSTAGVNGQPLIVGLVMSGGSKSVLVRAIGPSLANLNVTGVMDDPAMVVHATISNADTVVGANDNWGDGGQGPTLAAAFERLYAFPLPDPASKDTALLIDMDGSRTVHVNNAVTGPRGVVLVEVYDAGSGSSPLLVNVSARNYAGRDEDTLIAGIYINGNVPRRVLIRGVGPTLTDFNVTEVLADPKLEVHTLINQVDQVVATNDDWADEPDVAAVSAATYAFPLRPESTDAAIVVTLPAGGYTALVSGAGNATGEALVEVYDAP